MINKIGTIYLGIKEKSLSALAYSEVFMYRRIHFLVLTFGLCSQPSLQIHFFYYATIWYIIYLMQTMPHTSKFTTNTEFVDEIILILISYHFILFTDLIQNQSMVKYVGWSLVSHLLLLLSYNFAIMVGINGAQVARRIKLWLIKRANL